MWSSKNHLFEGFACVQPQALSTNQPLPGEDAQDFLSPEVHKCCLLSERAPPILSFSARIDIRFALMPAISPGLRCMI
jgi:hypothetical protein